MNITMIKSLLPFVLFILAAMRSLAQPVTFAAASEFNTMFLKSDGSLWGAGGNTWGQLGNGTNGSFVQINLPELIVSSNVTSVVPGWEHCVFIKANGSLWGMGQNGCGQLGDNFRLWIDQGHYITLPEQIVGSNVTAAASGYLYTLFTKNDGSLWGTGDNHYGQLGDGTYNPTNLVERIVASNVVGVTVGFIHTLFLKNDGSLWGMGYNGAGQLGDGTFNNTNRPELIVASNVTAVAAGYQHTLFLKNDGSLWAMGGNNYGQLGDGTYVSTNRPEMIVASNVTAIAAGYYHNLFLMRDGSLWGFGGNLAGELGIGNNGTWTNLPTQIVPNGVVAISAQGAFFLPPPASIGGGVDAHSVFVKSDGSLWGMGDKSYGMLGTATKTLWPQQILGAYNRVSCQYSNGLGMQLSFVGLAGTNYALDRSTSLTTPNWLPQVTNTANSYGSLVFTNAPDTGTNNFWRVRSVP